MTFSPTRRRTLIAGSAAAGLAAVGVPVFAQKKYGPGVTDSEIKLGQTMPYSGPASAYGAIGKTHQAFFKMLNEKGGIKGRKINLISLDDGYSPPKTVEMVRRLVEQEEVFALFNTLGTPCNTAIHKYVNAKKVPHLLLATGATKWGDPKNFPWTMGYNLSYQAEGAIYARYLIKNRPNAKIGVLYQNDDYGKDLLQGFEAGLGSQHAKMVLAKASYEVTDPTVDSQILTLQGSGADTFMNITTPKFGAQAIRKAFDSGWKPFHIVNNVSASVGAVFKPAGIEKAKDVFTLAYYKDPTDPRWKDDPAMIEWRDFMTKYYPDGDQTDTGTIYGYISAQTMVQILEQCGDELTRENVMKQAANLKNLRQPLFLPGIAINTSPTDFFPFEQGQMRQFNGTTWDSIGEVVDATVG